MTESQHIEPLVPVRPEPSRSEQPPTAPRAPKRSNRSTSPFVRVGIVTGAAALVLVGAVSAMGASPSPSGATTPNAPSASGDPNGGMGWGHRGPGMPGMGGMGDMDFGGAAHGFGAVTITGIDGSNLALKTDDGWTRTIAVTSDTTITKAGATIAIGDLAVGDEIRFAETRATDGTYSVTKIVVVVPSLAGEVTAKTSDSITITRRDGTTATIHVSSLTTYTVEGVTSPTLADIAVGMRVWAEGTSNSDGSLDASSVTAGLAGHDGMGHHGGPDDDSNGTSPSASPNP